MCPLLERLTDRFLLWYSRYCIHCNKRPGCLENYSDWWHSDSSYCEGWKYLLVFIFVVFVDKKRKTKIKTNKNVFVISRRFCQWKNRLKSPSSCWENVPNFQDSLLHNLRLSQCLLWSNICLPSEWKVLQHVYPEYVFSNHKFWVDLLIFALNAISPSLSAMLSGPYRHCK